MARMTITVLADRLETEADAYEYLEELRWPTGPSCAHCGSRSVRFMVPKNGHSRLTSGGMTRSGRRVWQCRDCREQFSVLTGTPMHGTKVSVRIWVFAIFEMCSSKNGVSAREIERKYGLCLRSAWFMMHRIREMRRGETLRSPMAGTILADETFIGGKWPNKHVSERQAVRPFRPGQDDPQGKTPVLSLINARTGEVRSAVIRDVTGATLRKEIADQVDMGRSYLQTDEWRGYLHVGREFLSHESVDHSADEYVRRGRYGKVTTNRAEGFFGQLKRSIDGTHHKVSKVHLPRYLAEFDYRYSTCKRSDTERIEMLVGSMPQRRLTYKRITA